MNSKAVIETANKLIRQARVAEWLLTLFETYDSLDTAIDKRNLEDEDYSIVFQRTGLRYEDNTVEFTVSLQYNLKAVYETTTYCGDYYTTKLDLMVFNGIGRFDRYIATVQQEMMEA